MNRPTLYPLRVDFAGKDARTPGWVLVGVGLVTTVVGLMVVASNSSQYTLDNDTSANRKRTSTFALTPTRFVF